MIPLIMNTLTVNELGQGNSLKPSRPEPTKSLNYYVCFAILSPLMAGVKIIIDDALA
jgi:hypothetical protein